MSALELQQRVNQLYRSPPGSEEQKSADAWLSAFMATEEAWLAVLEVLGMGASAADGAVDEALDFLATKILQVKVQKQWETATPAVRQGVEERLCMQLRSLADGSSKKSMLVKNQLVLAFVHFSLQHLCEHAAAKPGFIEQLCQVLGIALPVDLVQQWQAFMILLDIVHWLPTELQRLDVDDVKFSALAESLKVEAPTAAALIKCILEGGGTAPNTNTREVKAAALYCLLAWVSYDDDFPPLMALSDLSSCGLLHLLDRHADLTEAGGHDMLVASRALQVMVEALRVPSRDGVALLSEDEDTQAQAVASADAVLLVARACLRACPQVLQMQQTPQSSSSVEGGLQELTRVAGELVGVLIERHGWVFTSQPWYSNFRQQRGVGEEVLEGLYGGLLSFTAHADLDGVASPALEVWYYAPRFQGRQCSPEAAALLPRLLLPLLEVLTRQCAADPSLCDEATWASVLAGTAKPEQLGDAEEAIATLMAFRREAGDTIEAVVTTWPEGLRARDFFLSAISQAVIAAGASSGGVGDGACRGLEAALWGLVAVAAGQSAQEDGGDDEDEDEEDGRSRAGPGRGFVSGGSGRESEEEGGGREGGAGAGGAGGRVLPSPCGMDVAWEAVLSSLPSLEQHWPSSVLVTACRLVQELAPLLRRAPLASLEAVLSFLTRALTRPHTVTPAARALKLVAMDCCATHQELLASPEAQRRVTSLLLAVMLSADATQALGRSPPEAYAHAAEATSSLACRSGLSAVDSLCQLLLVAASSLAMARAHLVPRSLALAKVTRAVLLGVAKAGGHVALPGEAAGVAEVLLERAWPAVVEEGLLRPASETRAPVLVESAGLTLAAALSSSPTARQRLLPAVLGWVLPFLEQTRQVADTWRAAERPTSHQPPPSSSSSLGALLWSPPIKVVARVVQLGSEQEAGPMEGWAQVQGLVDAVLETTDRLLEGGGGDGWPYNPTYYSEVFTMLRQLALNLSSGAARWPASGMAGDPWAMLRGVQLASLCLEVPVQEAEVLRPLCGFLSAVLRLHDFALPPEAMLRLMGSWLLAAAGRVNPSCLRSLSDCMFTALHGHSQLSGLFQASLTYLTTSTDQQQQPRLRSSVDPRVLEWADRAFLQCRQRNSFVRAVRLYYEVCAGLRPLAELK